jgi:Tfp pilus assembly protein PilN
MIRINLLPESSEPVEFQFNPVYPLAFVGAVVSILIFMTYHKEITLRDSQRVEIVRCNNEIKQLEPIIAQVEALEGAKAQLSQKKGVIQSIENERLRYPLLMDDIVRLLPSNVWLGSMVTSIAGSLMSVTLQVSALDNYALADLISNLESSQIFTDTDLGPVSASQSAGGGQLLNFQITTTYRKSNMGTDALKKS